MPNLMSTLTDFVLMAVPEILNNDHTDSFYQSTCVQSNAFLYYFLPIKNIMLLGQGSILVSLNKPIMQLSGLSITAKLTISINRCLNST